jgi:hypothetical protein
VRELDKPVPVGAQQWCGRGRTGARCVL